MRRGKREGNGVGELPKSADNSSKKRTRGASTDENVVEKRVTRSSVKGVKAQMSEYGNRKAHPLLIDHILDKVFGYVLWNDKDTKKRAERRYRDSGTPVSGIRNVRLVCKLWKDRATLLFRDVKSASEFGYSSMSPNPNLVSERFLEVMQSSSMIPVQRYILRDSVFSVEKLTLLENFFKICGPTAVEIELVCSENISQMPVILRNYLGFFNSAFTLHLEKLKTLELQDWMMINLENYPTQHPVLNLTCVMLESAPNLKKFSLSADVEKLNRGDDEGRAKESLLEILRRVPVSVEELYLNSPLLSDSHWNTLAGIESLALSEFQFIFQPTALSSTSAIRNFLQRHSDTLKKLTLSRDCPFTSELIPPLPELLHIDLDLSEENLVPAISIPDYFPNLIDINLNRTFLDHSDPLFEWLSSHTCPSVKKLILPRYFGTQYIQNSVSRIARSFPNLTVLHLSGSRNVETALRGIFTYFPGIQELTIEWLTTDIRFNWLLSGVSEKDYKRVVKGGEKVLRSLNLEAIQCNPSILNLTELRKLVIIGWNEVWPLTNFLVQSVLSKMDNLEELRVPAAKITSRSEKLLRRKLKVLEVNTVTHKGLGFVEL